jgi:hypothetical protein
MIIEKLGGGTIDPIGGSEFDNLYVITTSRWWFFKSTRMIRFEVWSSDINDDAC